MVIRVRILAYRENFWRDLNKDLGAYWHGTSSSNSTSKSSQRQVLRRTAAHNETTF